MITAWLVLTERWNIFSGKFSGIEYFASMIICGLELAAEFEMLLEVATR